MRKAQTVVAGKPRSTVIQRLYAPEKFVIHGRHVEYKLNIVLGE